MLIKVNDQFMTSFCCSTEHGFHCISLIKMSSWSCQTHYKSWCLSCIATMPPCNVYSGWCSLKYVLWLKVFQHLHSSMKWVNLCTLPTAFWLCSWTRPCTHCELCVIPDYVCQKITVSRIPHHPCIVIFVSMITTVISANVAFWMNF